MATEGAEGPEGGPEPLGHVNAMAGGVSSSSNEHIQTASEAGGGTRADCAKMTSDWDALEEKQKWQQGSIAVTSGQIVRENNNRSAGSKGNREAPPCGK